MPRHSSFQFKQFVVEHDECEMKVGTDGVLLGAWAKGGNSILDIGCGTGLIALMMAQRYVDAEILAIDKDLKACKQAERNFFNSPFSKQITAKGVSFQEYLQGDGLQSLEFFDSIVCNPPFFSNSLQSKNFRRMSARHSNNLPFSVLIRGVKQLLTPDGRFSVVLPTTEYQSFSNETVFAGLFLSRRINIKTVNSKPIKRLLLEYRKSSDNNYYEETVTLFNDDGSKSVWYEQLTNDFYLDK